MFRHFSLLLQQYLQKLFGATWGIIGAWWPLGTAQHCSPVVTHDAAQRLPLPSSEVLPNSVERGRQGLSRAAADLTSAVSKSLHCYFDIHAALIWIWAGGPPQGGAGTPFLFLFAKSLEKADDSSLALSSATCSEGWGSPGAATCSF